MCVWTFFASPILYMAYHATTDTERNTQAIWQMRSEFQSIQQELSRRSPDDVYQLLSEFRHEYQHDKRKREKTR